MRLLYQFVTNLSIVKCVQFVNNFGLFLGRTNNFHPKTNLCSVFAVLCINNHVFVNSANISEVEKILHKIENVKEALALRKDAAAKEAFEEVRKAEQMFLDALAEKGMRFEDGKIIGANEEEEIKRSRGIDKQKKEGYNRKKEIQTF